MKIERFTHEIFIFKGVRDCFAIEDLEIWQEARELCKLIFSITSSEPFSKDFKFRDQIRASVGSTMDNIAEGFERGGNKEFGHKYS